MNRIYHSHPASAIIGKPEMRQFNPGTVPECDEKPSTFECTPTNSDVISKKIELQSLGATLNESFLGVCRQCESTNVVCHLSPTTGQLSDCCNKRPVNYHSPVECSLCQLWKLQGHKWHSKCLFWQTHRRNWHFPFLCNLPEIQGTVKTARRNLIFSYNLYNFYNNYKYYNLPQFEKMPSLNLVASWIASAIPRRLIEKRSLAGRPSLWKLTTM